MEVRLTEAEQAQQLWSKGINVILVNDRIEVEEGTVTLKVFINFEEND